jgi:hypothetical protein
MSVEKEVPCSCSCRANTIFMHMSLQSRVAVPYIFRSFFPSHLHIRVLQLVKEMMSGSNAGLRPNIVFDQSSKLILYASLPGIKIVNLVEV